MESFDPSLTTLLHEDLAELDAIELARRPAPIAGFTCDSVMAGEFINGTRKFVLSKPIRFHSAKYYNPATESYIWEVKPDDIIDGASIPRSCWSIIGAPYSGKYRLSSAIHDVLCSTYGYNLLVSSRETHLLFDEMIEAEGVDGWKHWAMAKGVLLGGPKW